MTPLFATAYFGSIAYFRELLRFPEVTIEASETFPKQTYRNRCTILSANGPLRLTVPVEKPQGSKTLTKNIFVTNPNGANWQQIHWRTIVAAYASAPYFEHYASEIEALVFHKEDNLVLRNTLITASMAHLFDLEIQLQLSEEFIHQGVEQDYRFIDFESELPENYTPKPYTQVLFDKPTFYPNPSILDLLFCEGPMGRKWLIDS